jgi:hypothetical protein
MGETVKAFVFKHEGRRQFRSRRAWNDLKEIDLKGVDWINPVLDFTAWILWRDNENAGI